MLMLIDVSTIPGMTSVERFFCHSVCIINTRSAYELMKIFLIVYFSDNRKAVRYQYYYGTVSYKDITVKDLTHRRSYYNYIDRYVMLVCH